MAPRYLGPMVVLQRTRNGAYRLAELDGAISKLHYAAFRLIPYYAHSSSFIPVTHVVGHDELQTLLVDDPPSCNGRSSGGDDKGLTGDGQYQTPREV